MAESWRLGGGSPVATCIHGAPGLEVEFMTVMTFAGWSAVEAFAGASRTGSVVPPAARSLLKRFDEHSQHYDVAAHHDPVDAGRPADR